MPAQLSARKEKRVSNNDTGVVESLASLLQVLAENSASGNGSSSVLQSSGDAEEILVDVELDGTRYLLMRVHKPEERVQLSPREQEIVRMVAGGHPNKIIASVLNISSWTVCTYLRRHFRQTRRQLACCYGCSNVGAGLHARAYVTPAAQPIECPRHNATKRRTRCFTPSRIKVWGDSPSELGRHRESTKRCPFNSEVTCRSKSF